MFSAANKQIQQNALVQLSNILVNNPNVNQPEYLKRVFEAFDFTDPEKLISSNMQTPTQETTEEPTTALEEATGTEGGEETTTDEFVNADVGMEEMVADDTAFLQNITGNA